MLDVASDDVVTLFSLIDELSQKLDNKANIDHNHEIGQINGLNEALLELESKIGQGGSNVDLTGVLLAENNLNDVKNKIKALENLGALPTTGGIITGRIAFNNSNRGRLVVSQESTLPVWLDFETFIGVNCGNINASTSALSIEGPTGSVTSGGIRLNKTYGLTIISVRADPISFQGTVSINGITYSTHKLLDTANVMRSGIGAIISITSDLDYIIYGKISGTQLSTDNGLETILSGTWFCYFKQTNGDKFNYNFIRMS